MLRWIQRKIEGFLDRKLMRELVYIDTRLFHLQPKLEATTSRIMRFRYVAEIRELKRERKAVQTSRYRLKELIRLREINCK